MFFVLDNMLFCSLNVMKSAHIIAKTTTLLLCLLFTNCAAFSLASVDNKVPITVLSGFL